MSAPGHSAQQQEPYGYIATRYLEVFTIYSTQCQVVLYKAPSKTRTAIYTSLQPAQRKPLTDEQIGMAFRKAFPVGGVLFTNGAIDFARAIEAAHNIKGDA